MFIITFIIEIIVQFVAYILSVIGMLVSFAGFLIVVASFLESTIQRFIAIDLEGYLEYLPESFPSWPVWMYGAAVIVVGLLIMSISSVMGKHIGK